MKICLMLTSLPLINGCSALPEALSAAGGAFTLGEAYLNYSDTPVEVISKDCLLARYILLSPEGKLVLPLIDKRKIAANNRALVEGCENITRIE